MARPGEVGFGRARCMNSGRRLAAGLVSVLAVGGAGHAQDMPSDADGFTAAIARLYREHAPDLETRIVGPLELAVKSASGVEKVYLNAIFSACARNRDSCAMIVARQVEAMNGGLVARSAPALSEIRITVRPSAYVDELVALRPAGEEVVAEPLVDDLWMLGVRDEPTTIATLSRGDLDALKLSADQALELGKRNLEGTVRRLIAEAVERGVVGVNRFQGNEYTASLLAFPELWRPLAEKFDGQLLVAAPASDIVLLADGRQPASQAEMLTAVAQATARAERPVSPVVFEWTPTGWNKIAVAEVKPP